MGITRIQRTFKGAAVVFAAATVLAAQPLTVDLDHSDGPLHAATAFAKDGGKGGGSNSGGGGGRGGSSGGGHSSGGSGSSGGGGKNSSDGGSSGRDGSRGHGADGGGRAGHESGRRGRGADDNRPGDDRSASRQRGDDAAGRRGAHHLTASGAKVEVAGRNIEVTSPDGFKQEIENGRYEMKDPRGRTIVERAATPEDRARLFGAAR